MSVQESGEMPVDNQMRRILVENENDLYVGSKPHNRDGYKHSKGVASLAKFYSLEPAMEVERLTIQLSLLKAERNSLDLEAKRKGDLACLAESRAKEAEERLKSESKRREYFERECTVLQKKIADILSAYVGNDTESEQITGSCALIELRAELNRKDILIENLQNEVSLLQERVEMFKRFEGEIHITQKNDTEHKLKLELINKELQKLLKIEYDAQAKLRADLTYSENARYLLEDKCALFSHRQTHLQSKNSNIFAGKQDFEQNHVIHTSMLSQQFEDPSFTQGINDKELQTSISNQNQELLFSFPVEIKTPQQSQNQPQLLLSSLKEQIDVLSEKKEEMNGQLEEILMQSMKGNSKKAKDLKHQFEKHFEEFFEELAKQTEHLLNLKMKVDQQDEMITACKNQSHNQIEELKRKHKTQIKLLQKNIEMLNRQKEDIQKQVEAQISEVQKIQQKEITSSEKKENNNEQIKDQNAGQTHKICEKSKDISLQQNSVSKKFMVQKLRILENSTAPASKTTRDSSASYTERVNVDISQNVSPFLEYPVKNQNTSNQESRNFSVLSNKINQTFDQQSYLSQASKINHKNYLSIDISDKNQNNSVDKSFVLNSIDAKGLHSTQQPALDLLQKETLKKNGRGSRSTSQLNSKESYSKQYLKPQQEPECSMSNKNKEFTTKTQTNTTKPVFDSTIFNSDKNGSILSTSSSHHHEQIIPNLNRQKQPELGLMATQSLNQQNSQRTNQIKKQFYELNENNLKQSSESQNKSHISRINSQNGSCYSMESVKSIHQTEIQTQEIYNSILNTKQNSFQELNPHANFTFTQSLNNNNSIQHSYLHQSQN